MKRKDLHRRLILNTPANFWINQLYSTLATNIILAKKSSSGNIFLVTSSLPREGRSLTVLNLAVILANWGKKVLLIDGDLRNPSLHLALDITPAYTFSEVVIEEIDLKKAMVRINRDNFHLLPGSKDDIDPLRVLNSNRVKEMLEEVKSSFDFILIDSPPLLQYPDSVVWVRLVNGVILVARTGITTKTSLHLTKDKIETQGGEILGVVLNREKSPLPRFLQRIFA